MRGTVEGESSSRGELYIETLAACIKGHTCARVKIDVILRGVSVEERKIGKVDLDRCLCKACKTLWFHCANAPEVRVAFTAVQGPEEERQSECERDFGKPNYVHTL